MSFLKEVAAEISAMFVGDLRLALCILTLVGGTAVLVRVLDIGSLAAGAVLLLGCLAILIESVRSAALTHSRR